MEAFVLPLNMKYVAATRGLKVITMYFFFPVSKEKGEGGRRKTSKNKFLLPSTKLYVASDQVA